VQKRSADFVRIAACISRVAGWCNQENRMAAASNIRLTTDHPASSLGVPVLVLPDGIALGPLDLMPDSWGGRLASDWVMEHEQEFDPTLVKAFTQLPRAYAGD
jgi:hypothetical protein